MNRTRVAAIVGLLALGVSIDAEAQTCRVSVYHPARYTNGAGGDVALTAAQSVLVQRLTQNLGMTYGHSAVLYDSSGSRFTESTVNNTTPPSSDATGEPHVCSKVLSPYNLQRLHPGVVNAGYRDAVAGVLVKGGARAGCIAPADTYHINSIKNRLHGGSCAALDEDDCGARVTGPWQRVFSRLDHHNEAIFIYNQAYTICTTVINQSWPWAGIGCGGVDATGVCYGLNGGVGYGCDSACDRAASQVVNEFAMKAQAFPSFLNDGWSDYSVFGQLLGGAKINAQAAWYWYNGSYTSIGGNWTPRLPDNIYASAAPTGHAIWGATIAAGYYTTTTAPNGSCCGLSCCGACYSGICDRTGCGGGGGGPAVIKR